MSVHILGLVAAVWLAVPLLAPVALLLVPLGVVVALGSSVAEGRELGHPPSQEHQRWPGAVRAAGFGCGRARGRGGHPHPGASRCPEWAGTATLLATLALTAVAMAVVLRGRTATPAEAGMNV